MKAVEGKRRVRNQPTRDVCFHGSNKYTNGSHGIFCLKATVENPRGSVEKLSPQENPSGAYTVLRGSVRAPSHCPLAECEHPQHSP